jgi:antitoxin HigA-1
LIIIKEIKMNPTNKMRPIHPGEVLREEFLLPLGMSAHALALELKVPAPRINDIVRERRAVTPDTALRLSQYFGTTPQFWLNLQTSFDLKKTEKEVGEKIAQEVHARLVA